jgi:hypothetical protein
MPAWIAGIQAPRMRPHTSMSSWVPAVHAGTTSSYNDYVTHTNLMAIVLHPTQFSKEITKGLGELISDMQVSLPGKFRGADFCAVATDSLHG